MNSDLGLRVRSLRDHGASQSVSHGRQERSPFLLPDFDMLGYNYRMTDFQGALGTVQMDRAEAILVERSRQAAQYDAHLKNVSWLACPSAPEGYSHGYQSYVCLMRTDAPAFANIREQNERRNRLMANLERQGISTRQGTHAAALLGYYAQKYGVRAEQFPNAYFAEQLSLALPLYHGLRDEDIALICQALTKAWDE